MPPRKKSKKSVVSVARTAGAGKSPRYLPFGPPALVEGEDPAAYDNLHDRISEAVAAKDFVEEIWVRDVVDLTWDCLRMRRLKANLLTSTTSEGLGTLIRPLLEYKAADQLLKDWALRDRAAVKEVDEYLAAMGVTMDAPIARALAMRIDQFDRLDRMIMNAEGRRNAALREVDRHRSNLGQALRRASDDVIEGEFEDVGSPQQPAIEEGADAPNMKAAA
jgi:hypothetical protein